MAFANIAAREILFTDALYVEMGRFQIWIRDNQDLDVLLLLDTSDFTAFFVEQERCDVRRHLRGDLGR